MREAHSCGGSHGKTLAGLNGARFGSWCWRECQRGERRGWDALGSIVSRCSPSLRVMLGWAKGEDRVREGFGSSLPLL